MTVPMAKRKVGHCLNDASFFLKQAEKALEDAQDQLAGEAKHEVRKQVRRVRRARNGILRAISGMGLRHSEIGGKKR